MAKRLCQHSPGGQGDGDRQESQPFEGGRLQEDVQHSLLASGEIGI